MPFTESVNFAAALTHLNHPHELVAFSIFQHAEVSSSPDMASLLRDSPRLFRALHRAMLNST